jgi:hypothetical protein
MSAGADIISFPRPAAADRHKIMETLYDRGSIASHYYFRQYFLSRAELEVNIKQLCRAV